MLSPYLFSYALHMSRTISGIPQIIVVASRGGVKSRLSEEKRVWSVVYCVRYFFAVEMIRDSSRSEFLESRFLLWTFDDRDKRRPYFFQRQHQRQYPFGKGAAPQRSRQVKPTDLGHLLFWLSKFFLKDQLQIANFVVFWNWPMLKFRCQVRRAKKINNLCVACTVDCR